MKKTGKDFVDDGYPAFGAGGINGFVNEYERDEDAVILSSNGARCGKCFLAFGKWTSLANTTVIIPDPNIADAKFLWYQLNDEKRWVKYGTGQPFIRPSMVKTHLVELPSIVEQRRIAAILDKAHEVKKSSKIVPYLRQQLILSIFSELFGDLRINSKSWPEKSLLELCDRVTVGYVGPLTPLYVESGIRCLRGLNIKRGRISSDEIKQISSESHNNLLKKSRLNAGDVVAIRTGNAGVSAVISEEYDDINCADLIIMTPGSEIEPSYLCEFLNQKFGDADSIQGAVGAIQKHFNIGSAKKVMIPLPPMKLQHRYNQFLDTISQIDSQAELAERSSLSIIQEILT